MTKEQIIYSEEMGTILKVVMLHYSYLKRKKVITILCQDHERGLKHFTCWSAKTCEDAKLSLRTRDSLWVGLPVLFTTADIPQGFVHVLQVVLSSQQCSAEVATPYSETGITPKAEEGPYIQTSVFPKEIVPQSPPLRHSTISCSL